MQMSVKTNQIQQLLMYNLLCCVLNANTQEVLCFTFSFTNLSLVTVPTCLNFNVKKNPSHLMIYT